MAECEVTIDGRRAVVAAGRSLIDVAADLGVTVPTLCRSTRVAGSASCMVCAVWAPVERRFIAACSTTCRAGLEVTTDGPAVRDFRRQMIELLLGEHRGDCEAPCRLVCPQDLHLPDFLARLARGEGGGGFPFDPEWCSECGGNCEKACRRGALDGTVEIRELLVAAGVAVTSPRTKRPGKARYVHRANRMTVSELKAQAEAAFRGYQGVAPSTPMVVAAARCLQCACADRVGCDLRRLATEVGAKPRRYTAHQPKARTFIDAGRVVFEPTKCIRCERCVRLGESLMEGRGPAMAGRGQAAVLRPPVGSTYADAFDGHERAFVDECPTGALAQVAEVVEPDTERKG